MNEINFNYVNFYIEKAKLPNWKIFSCNSFISSFCWTKSKFYYWS